MAQIITDNFKSWVARKSFEKIVSLVPSISYTLYELTGGRQPVGITKFCNRPEMMYRTVPRVGGTKNISIEKISQLQPDLILSSREENVKEQIEKVSEIAPVWLTDIKNLKDMKEFLITLGDVLKLSEKVSSVIKEMDKVLKSIQNRYSGKSVVYLIWREPWMTVGGDTFVHEMLQHIGLKNLFGHLTRYPIVTLEEIRSLQPDYVFLSSEPYPFKLAEVNTLQLYFEKTRVCYVPGELFSWYGIILLEWKNFDWKILDK